MKILIAFLFLIAIEQLHAQKDIDGMVIAEKSFAAYSVAHGAKEAFLKFLDSNGIVFEQGKAMNGMEVWKKKEIGPLVLNWGPQYAEIASSNDFGYTTGPWELRAKAAGDSVIARGRFTTVWHVNSDGEWKFLVDLGAGNSPKALLLSVSKIKAKKITGDTSTNELLKAEQNFIETFSVDKSKAYKLFLSKQSILNRNGLQNPASGKKDQADMIRRTPSDIRFSVTGSGISPAGDMGYTYGNTISNNKPENFLRIWRKEESGWKIALEVLRY